MQAVLAVLLANPRAWYCGNNVTNRAKVNHPATVYRILYRLRAAGWIQERDDPADRHSPSAIICTKKRYYRLTEAGAIAARTALAQAGPLPVVKRWPAPGKQWWQE